LRRISEEFTRKEMIDPQLEKAGWYLRDHSKVKNELPPVPPLFAGVDGHDAEPWNGVTDTCLYCENSEVLAAVVQRVESLPVPRSWRGGRVPPSGTYGGRVRAAGGGVVSEFAGEKFQFIKGLE